MSEKGVDLLAFSPPMRQTGRRLLGVRQSHTLVERVAQHPHQGVDHGADLTRNRAWPRRETTGPERTRQGVCVKADSSKMSGLGRWSLNHQFVRIMGSSAWTELCGRSQMDGGRWAMRPRWLLGPLQGPHRH